MGIKGGKRKKGKEEDNDERDRVEVGRGRRELVKR